MVQVASAGDNAAMESFFALLQKNVLNPRRWATRTQLRLAIITWIDRTYHRRRRQARLGQLTSVEYETINTPKSQSPPENRCRLLVQQSPLPSGHRVVLSGRPARGPSKHQRWATNSSTTTLSPSPSRIALLTPLIADHYASPLCRIGAGEAIVDPCHSPPEHVRSPPHTGDLAGGGPT